MITLNLTEEHAIMLQNALTTIQGEQEPHAAAATDLMALRLRLADAMSGATPRACRIVIYYEDEILADGEMPGEPSVEMTYQSKAEAAAMMMHMVAASRAYAAQPTKPRHYVFDLAPGGVDVTGKSLG